MVTYFPKESRNWCEQLLVEESTDGGKLAFAGTRFHKPSSGEDDTVQAAERRDGHENGNDPFQPREEFHSKTLRQRSESCSIRSWFNQKW